VFKSRVRSLILLGLGLSLLGTHQLWAQSSHQSLSRELVRDLHKAVADSIRLPVDQILLSAAGGSELDAFIARSLQGQAESLASQVTRIDFLVEDMQLHINRTGTETGRNTSYLRQLDLSVRFDHAGKTYRWSGSISDRVPGSAIGPLLEEDVPVVIQGDLSRDEPRLFWVMLSTLSVFALGAALFFIRT